MSAASALSHLPRVEPQLISTGHKPRPLKSILKRTGPRRVRTAGSSNSAVPAKLQRVIVGPLTVPFASESPRRKCSQSPAKQFSLNEALGSLFGQEVMFTLGPTQTQVPQVTSMASSSSSFAFVGHNSGFTLVSPTRMSALAVPPASPPRAHSALDARTGTCAASSSSSAPLQHSSFLNPLSMFAAMDSPAASNQSSIGSAASITLLPVTPNSLLPAFIGAFDPDSNTPLKLLVTSTSQPTTSSLDSAAAAASLPAATRTVFTSEMSGLSHPTRLATASASTSVHNPLEALSQVCSNRQSLDQNAAELVEDLNCSAAEVEVVCESAANECTGGGGPLFTAAHQDLLETPFVKRDTSSPSEQFHTNTSIGPAPAAAAAELDADCFIVNCSPQAAFTYASDAHAMHTVGNVIGSTAVSEQSVSYQPVQLLVANADGSPAFALLPLSGGLQLQSSALYPSARESDTSALISLSTAPVGSTSSSNIAPFAQPGVSSSSTHAAVVSHAFSFANAPITARRSLGAATSLVIIM